jgi:hypothetical protein
LLPPPMVAGNGEIAAPVRTPARIPPSGNQPRFKRSFPGLRNASGTYRQSIHCPHRWTAYFSSQPQPQCTSPHWCRFATTLAYRVRIAITEVNKMSIGTSNLRQNALAFHLPGRRWGATMSGPCLCFPIGANDYPRSAGVCCLRSRRRAVLGMVASAPLAALRPTQRVRKEILKNPCPDRGRDASLTRINVDMVNDGTPVPSDRPTPQHPGRGPRCSFTI